MKKRQLNSSQCAFLKMVYEAAFTNPFSEDRTKLDARIAGLNKNNTKNPEALLGAAIANVNSFLAKLDAPEKFVLNNFHSDEQRLVKYALFFSLFHGCMEKFDTLIARQVKTREGTCSVPFAKDVLGQMRQRGVSEEESLRFFSFFYQLRRGYYFIHYALVGRSASMKHLRMVLWNNIFTHDTTRYVETLWNRLEDFSTLILGETGTGKGAAATAIGRSGYIPFNSKQNCFSESFMASFVELNLSQFPEALIESELFGHRKGAFTGAIEAHKGTFSLCSPHGSVFLDEIGDASIPVQTKLLRVLQDRTFSPVGSHERQRFRGRIIAATNKPVDELRRTGQFRDDFYYRLCSDLIQVPPLRQRIQEAPLELDDLLTIVIKRITGTANKQLQTYIKKIIIASVGENYGWPGNVRELEQSVRRVLLSGKYTVQKPAAQTDIETIQSTIESGSYDAQSLISDYCKHLHAIHGTYEAVARITTLDRRTVKKHITRKT